MKTSHMIMIAACLLMVLSTVSAVAPARAGEYVAFSLGVAQKQIEAAGRADWRREQPEVFALGGITKIRGLAYDRKTGDTILVGEHDPKRPILTLDDFAVALRARFIHNQWPLVSIDPTPDTKKTNLQHVRYEGGIEETAFGMDMFDADLRLKKIALGLLERGVMGLKSPWEMNIEQIMRGEGYRRGGIKVRFWLYPVNPLVKVSIQSPAANSIIARWPRMRAPRTRARWHSGWERFPKVTGGRRWN